MGKKLMQVSVKGDRKNWAFTFSGDPQFVDEWRRDGIDVVVLENSIPEGLPSFIPVRLWIFLQDVFNFKNPFRK